MKESERDHDLEQKIVAMLISKDQEMVEMGLILAETYITSYKDFMRMRDEYIIPQRPEEAIYIEHSYHYQRRIMPFSVERKLAKLARDIERKRRSGG